jgi:hypothetical protein
MEKKWFVFADQLVRGPLTTNNIEEGLATGRWTLDTLIWWKGQTQWISISNWRQQIPETGFITQIPSKQDWYLESNGKHTGPMSRVELIEFLKASANPFQYSLWHPGLDHWKQIYFFEEILSELGRSRRVHSRAPLPGNAEVIKKEHRFTLQTSNIGPGGLGLLEGQNLVPGQTVQLTIRSPALPEAIRSTGQILYVRGTGFAGLKFETMHVEAQSAIVDYIKQFETEKAARPLPASNTKKKAA